MFEVVGDGWLWWIGWFVCVSVCLVMSSYRIEDQGAEEEGLCKHKTEIRLKHELNGLVV